METIDHRLLTFLINALWQVPVAAGVAGLACRFMRNSPARYRHTVCVVALMAAVLLPIAGMRRSAPQRQTFAVPRQVAVSTVPAAPTTAAPQTAPARTLPVPRTAANLATWAIGLFLLFQLGRLLRASARTVEACRTATPNDRPIPAWDRCRAAFGLRRAELRWSARIAGPATAGRTVILPESMAEASDDVLSAAIGHEAAHLSRHDFASHLACELLALPISFHPATAWLRREIARTRELACDDLVASRILTPEVYARSIVSIAATITGFSRPIYTLGVLDGDILEERVRQLLARPVANLKRARLLLAAGVTTLAVCVAIASGLAISARAQSPAQADMRAAGEAYNAGRYADAATNFEKAVAADPANANARLYLANTYLRQHLAEGKFLTDGAVLPPLLQKARAEYEEVLRRDPKNGAAANGIVSLNGSSRAAESRALMLRMIEADPKNMEAYYTIGVLDWGIAYRTLRNASSAPGPTTPPQIPDAALRAKLRAEILPGIEEGFRMLQVALQIDPGSSDSMAYMNLLGRLKARVVDDPAESERLIAQADNWVRKALQARADRPATNRASDHIDVDQPAPISIPSMIPAPPPPPPPPPGGFKGNGDAKTPPPPPPPPPPAK